MLPASDLTEILTNLSALNLQPNTAAQILAAVLVPLLRNSSGPDVDPDLELKVRKKRAGRLRSSSRRASSTRRRKKVRARRRAANPTEARERARAAIAANPDATLMTIAKIAKCSYGSAHRVRKELAVEARRKPGQPKPAAGKTPPNKDRRQRAQQFLKDELAHGPKQAVDVEAAAAKAHIDDQTLSAARADLGVVVSRANTGGPQAVQWSLPG